MGVELSESAVTRLVLAAMLALCAVSQAAAQTPKPPAQPDSVTIRIAPTELRTAVQIMQPYLDRPVIFSGPSGGPQVSLETPRPVARADVPRLLRGLLESANYELVEDSASGTYRARQKETIRPSPSPSIVVPSGLGGTPSARQSGAPELFVIALKHGRAADVATTINSLFGRSAPAAVGQNSNNRQPTLADELRANQVPPIEAQPPLPQAIPGTTGRAATLSGDLTIVPEVHSNSLLIRANRADFELIRAAVQQIDMRPPQVLIEVLIVEARRDRSFALGLAASIDDVTVAHSANTLVNGSYDPGTSGLGDMTLRLMGIGKYDINATVTAAAGRGDVKIISRPVVLTSNDEQAEVVVGSQRPFVQVSRSLPTDAGVRDQVVQYRDVGTKLSVRPTISVDGTVQLNVTQEVSSATTETEFNAPVISTRSVKTDLLVMDGQTITLGGLTDKEHDVQTQGIPLLSSIPFFGGFFGRHARQTTETELFIFLTPHVIRTDEDAARLTDPMRKRADQVRP